MPTRRSPGPDPRRGFDDTDPDGVVVPLRREGGLSDARRYRPRGRTVRESADPADASRRADRARRSAERRESGQPSRDSAGAHGPAEAKRSEGQGRRPADGSGQGRGSGDGSGQGRRTADGTGQRSRSGQAGGGSGTRGGSARGDRRSAADRGSGRSSGTRGGAVVPGPRSDDARSRRAGDSAARSRGGDSGARGRGARGSGRRSGWGAESDRSAPRQGTPRKGGTRKGTPRKGAATRPRPPARKRVRGRVARLGSPGRRLRLGTVVVLILFTLIGGRLVQLQLTDAPTLAHRALVQRLHTVPLPAARGSILDRNGQVLAHSVEARYVFADPTMIKDAAKVAARLSPVLGVARSTLEHDMRPQKLPDGSPSRFAYLARGVDIEIGNRVEAMAIPGIGVRPDERRDVPGHDLAANIVGVTGWNLDGLTGLEAKYNSLLRGVDGKREYEVGGNGEEIPDGFHQEVAPKPGGSVRLTLDWDIQFEAQRALYRQLHSLNADMGAAVVLDTKTGNVLAQASYPTYDAANFANSTTAQRTDYASQAVIEPGSVEKAITLGAGLQCGVIKPDSTIHVGPTIQVADTTYSDTTPLDDVDITLPGIFAYSSNVGTIKVANRLGAARLYDYQRKFGLGSATGEGMPGEADGIVRPAKDWEGSDHGSIPIGLGIAVTPLQLTAAYGAIANDGEYVQPHLIADTVSPDGTTSTPSVSRHRVLSPDIARAERKAMVAVTSAPGATGLSGAVDGYQIAAKTGTGQRVVNGSYQKGNVESFIGMAPAEHPRYVVGVFAHTTGSGEGANMGPVFQDLMRFTLGHQKVPPSGTKQPSFTLYRK